MAFGGARVYEWLEMVYLQGENVHLHVYPDKQKHQNKLNCNPQSLSLTYAEIFAMSISVSIANILRQ